MKLHAWDWPVILTVRDVGEITRLSRSKVYEMIHRKDFPAIREGRRVIIPRDAFFRWLDPSIDLEPTQKQGIGTPSPQENNKVTSVCINALTRAVKDGTLSIEDIVKWAFLVNTNGNVSHNAVVARPTYLSLSPSD